MLVHGLCELGVPLVPTQQGRTKIRGQGQSAVLTLDNMSEEDYPIPGQAAQVQIMASIDPGQERGDSLGWAMLDGAIELPKRELPERKVAAAVAARNGTMGASGEVDPATTGHEVLGDLTPRGPGANDEDCSRRQVGWIAVLAGVDLEDAPHGGCKRLWDGRALIRTGCDHHVRGLDRSTVCFDQETS
jgi:hypothetical protein